MKALRKLTMVLVGVVCLTASMNVSADDLQDVLARGELRHLGIPYANFVTGAGDGLDVEIAQGFARHLGVKYRYFQTDFYSVMRDLLGQEVAHVGDRVTLSGDFPVKGDMIGAGFTILPWREQVLLYSKSTFPSQVLLIAPSGATIKPIHGSEDLSRDIAETKALIGGRSLLVMHRTCLDPANYGLNDKGLDLKAYTRSTNLNEMIPAMLAGAADLSLLDVPDVLLDLQKWNGQIKVIGPISSEQTMGFAFRKSAPELRNAFNVYLNSIKADGTYNSLVDRYYPGIRSYFPKFFSGK
ncbi:Transporter substrate-binding domain-containing protein [Azospirillaceae bacterium]